MIRTEDMLKKPPTGDIPGQKGMHFNIKILEIITSNIMNSKIE